MRKLIDAAGIALADVHKWLPPRVADWPTPPKIVDKKAAFEWKLSWGYGDGWICWWCKCRPDEFVGLEVHHMARHDAPFAFALLCSTCHRHTEAAVHASSLHRLLTLKHQYDPEHTLWLPLAIGLGRFLPTEV